MSKVSPEEYAEKWGRRLKGSTEDIRRGVERVTEAPGAQAAKAADLMLARLTEAVSSGKWANQVGKVSLEEWKDAITVKGLTRIAQGVDQAQTKQIEMAKKLLAAVDASAAIARALPKGTLEDSINRAATYMREMHKRRIKT